MFTLCWLCGGPGTMLDGPGAPCRRCIQRVTARVSTAIGAPVAAMHGGSGGLATAGAFPYGSASVLSPWARDIDHRERRRPMSHHTRTPLPAMYVERAIVRPAMAHLSPRAVDAVLLAVMPVLLLEVVTRASLRAIRARARLAGDSTAH